MALPYTGIHVVSSTTDPASVYLALCRYAAFVRVEYSTCTYAKHVTSIY